MYRDCNMQEHRRNAKKLTPKQALAKAEHFCAYQERCQQEVRDKLYSWGLYPNDVEEIIADLITHNFLNEERFALAYVSGKFNMKAWGKVKIKQGLQQKRISTRLIHEALKTIDDDVYMEKLSMVLSKKAHTLQEKDSFKRKVKLTQYALARGFENDLIFDILKDNNLQNN